MKISLALGSREPLSRQTAWGCLTTNLALPGFGSLVAGYAAGYPQAVLGIGGLVLTMVFGVRFISWYIANWSRFYGAQADPFAALSDTWPALRWALLGIGLFVVALLWALATSLQIMRAAKNAEATNVPPRLGSTGIPPRL
jgi:hypothetical protein